MAGGGVLAAVKEKMSDRQALALCGAVAAVHAVLFFYPPSRTARAASYRAAAAVDRMNNGALAAIKSLRRQGPLTIVHYGSSVATRHLYYYFPDSYVVVLPGRPGQPAGERPQVFYHRETLPVPAGASGLIGRGSQKVVCLLPWNARPSDLPGAKRYGAVYYFERSPGTTLNIGPYRLVPGSAVTTSSIRSSP